MASFKQYTASGGASEAFSIPTFSSDEIKVYVDNVLKTATTHYNITSYTANGGTVTWTAGNVPASGTVRIVRDTGVTTARATYAAGSSIKAGDLNDNQTQALRSLEEQDDQLIQTYDVEDDAITTAKIKADNITSALIADDQINSEHYVDGSIDTAHIADAQVTTAKIAADAITAAKIADDVINSEHYAAGSIDTEHIADSQVTTAKIAADAVTNAKIADNSIDSEHYVDGSIDTVHLADNSVTGAKLAAGTIDTSDLADSGVTTAKIAADAVTGAKIADDAIDSEHLAADSIDAEHYAPGSVDTTALGADSVTAAKIADDVINTEHYAPGSINNAAIGNNAVNSDQIAADAITGAKIADNAIGAEHIAANAVTTSEIADAELTTLAGMQTGTASILAGGTALTATLAEINTVVDGKSVETTISDTDAAYPTSGAVVDYVAAQIAPIGGLEVIATDAVFPNTQPAAGVVISIADAGGLVVNGSGTSTTGRTVGGSTVTINNIASNFNSTTVDAGVAFMVSSTGSGQIYNYHKATLKEADLLSLSGDINDFAERYRVAGSAPSSSLDDGDLWWDTATDKLKVYDGSAWEEVASSGDFYINTISSYSGTGGNSASFNGSAYRFVLSNPGSTAQQHVVSINGVIQKPNSGTSQPSEGFVIDGSSIILSNAPASGADYFILTLGSTVSIGTPSDNTVSTAKIQNLAVTTDKLAADAVTGAKIADDAVGAEHIEVLDANLQFGDSVKALFGTGNDLELYHNGTDSGIVNNTGGLYIQNDGTVFIGDVGGNEFSAKFIDNGATELYYDNSKKLETTSEGISISSTTPTTFKITDTSGSGYEGYIQMRGNDMEIRGSSGQLEFYTGSEDGASSTLRGRFASGGNFQINNDAGKIELGTSQDLQIYHDGSNSNIKNATGWLNVSAGGSGFSVGNGDFSENLFKATNNGGVELYYDNVQKINTNASGVDIGTSGNACHLMLFDGGEARFGTGQDLLIKHTSTNSLIKHEGTGDLYIDAYAKDIYIRSGDGNTSVENAISCIDNAQVELYYSGTKKLETETAGVRVLGSEGADAEIHLYADEGDDNPDCWKFSASEDASRSRWMNKNSGSWETSIECNGDGNVELYYNNTKQFETAAHGINVLTDLGYSAVKLYSSSETLRGWLYADDSNRIYLLDSQGHATFKGIKDGAAELYYDNVKKLETIAGGVTVTGNFNVTGNITATADNGKLICGAGDDLQIFHQNDLNYVYGSTPVHVQSNTIVLESQGGEDYVKCAVNGAVELYYDNARKLHTESQGVNIDGTSSAVHVKMIADGTTRGYFYADTDPQIGILNNSGSWIFRLLSNGNYQLYGSSISDRDRKDNITTVTGTSLDKITKLVPKTYNWKKIDDKTNNDHLCTGFIAQEVKEHLPSLVTGTDGLKDMAVDYNGILAHAVKAITELSAEVETLKTKVAALEAK